MAKSSSAIFLDDEGETEIEIEQSLSPVNALENFSTELDRVIHERMRLAIISALAANQSLSFTDLKNALNTTDGNISVHARKLEESGYISCEKTFRNRKPLTKFKITQAGRDALAKYIDHMEALISAVKGT